jgi:hypothetical protein
MLGLENGRQQGCLEDDHNVMLTKITRGWDMDGFECNWISTLLMSYVLGY